VSYGDIERHRTCLKTVPVARLLAVLPFIR